MRIYTDHRRWVNFWLALGHNNEDIIMFGSSDSAGN